MIFAFFLSTFGGSPLQGGLERGLRNLGHDVVPFYNGRERDFDTLVIFNQCAHNTSYAYPDFPKYNVPIVFVDSAEYGYFKRLPSIACQYANAFASGSMVHDTKSQHEQTRLRDYLAGRSFPYFLREFSNYVEYPSGYFPIDYPLYHLSTCGEAPTYDHYSNRIQDLFVSWGASHPWRLHLTRLLREYKCNSEIKVIEENGTPRMNQHEYFQKTYNAKCSVSFDGYGSSSFRKTEVLTRSVLLQGPLTIKMYAPLTDGENCIAFNIESDGEEFLSSNICDKLRECLEDTHISFEIYVAGFDHCMTHYTEIATAKYFVDTIESHNSSSPTELDIQCLARVRKHLNSLKSLNPCSTTGME